MPSSLWRDHQAIVVWGLAVAPFAWMVLFWSFVLRARLSTGRWPAPNQPDPKDLGFAVHHMLLVVGLPCVLAATALAVALVALRYRSLSRVAILAVIGSATLLLWGRIDPGHFLYWFGD